MKSIHILFISLVLNSSCSSVLNRRISSLEGNSKSCQQNTIELAKRYAKTHKNKVYISQAKYDDLFDSLFKTQSGNLSTVYRTEWKGKGDYLSTAHYINMLPGKKLEIDLDDRFLSSLRRNFSESDINSPTTLRDPPPPKGSSDSTFTYYTKSLESYNGGKHQVRVRTYVRTLDLEQMPLETSARGYIDGDLLEFVKELNGKFSVYKIQNTSGEESSELISSKISLKKLKKAYGKKPRMYAYPHAKTFKLEVKTKLEESIELAKLEKLNGQNYVQKLSINITEEDLKYIFSLKRNSQDIRLLASHLTGTRGNERSRVDAVLDVLASGLEEDSEFLKLTGATGYQRVALEVKIPDLIDGKAVSVQTTFDDRMRLYTIYDKDGNLLTPVQTIAQGKYKKPQKEEEKIHYELKVPKVLIDLASNSYNSISTELRSLLEAFHSGNILNRGKFNYIDKAHE